MAEVPVKAEDGEMSVESVKTLKNSTGVPINIELMNQIDHPRLKKVAVTQVPKLVGVINEIEVITSSQEKLICKRDSRESETKLLNNTMKNQRAWTKAMTHCANGAIGVLAVSNAVASMANPGTGNEIYQKNCELAQAGCQTIQDALSGIINVAAQNSIENCKQLNESLSSSEQLMSNGNDRKMIEENQKSTAALESVFKGNNGKAISYGDKARLVQRHGRRIHRNNIKLKQRANKLPKKKAQKISTQIEDTNNSILTLLGIAAAVIIVGCISAEVGAVCGTGAAVVGLVKKFM